MVVGASQGDNSVKEFGKLEVSMTLTKARMAQRIADDCGFLKGEATELIEKLLEIMKKKLIAGDDIVVSGFGKWRVRSKRPRRGRNPQVQATGNGECKRDRIIKKTPAGTP